ncbi:MAG: MarR family transcriptional regulator [Acidimicrobiaceae bacterium]|nr:MarR family transcriptional regulator [Acidimicrobiaceae bacterium]
MDVVTSLPAELRVSILRLSRRLRQEAAGQITASQLSALGAVLRHGEISLGELAAFERVAPPSMTRIASRLEEQGLVARVADASDRRVARLVITPIGESLLNETRTRRDAFLAERIGMLTEEEREQLNCAVPILEKLASA